MKRLIISICFFMLFLVSPACATSSSSYYPLTRVCVKQASDYHKVPYAAVVSILAQEGGQVGRVSKNQNGSYDIGPMQINSIHLPRLKKFGVTEAQLKNNGCVNVYVGAWLLRDHIDAVLEKTSPKSNQEYVSIVWEAIGRYHSRTPKYKKRYQQHVRKRLNQIKDVKPVIDRANKSLMAAK